eukprot:gnl/TRDRNA2_/TRDRNA2_127493_c1_seq1.p1 gnl/TRDRNA2_/TRDRNA2_127493_c1~~gnl/TRDRNA2_/TRDRNA2_127493_c1_seq1.p1  ORF type:complete len:404 (-),score=69.53 gnl/TRDRNA2_/TRDRNA2_127493_c1_seq1:45-1199(-)
MLRSPTKLATGAKNAGSELLAAMRKRGNTDGDEVPAVVVEKREEEAPGMVVFRSGWSRQAKVPAPMSFSFRPPAAVSRPMSAPASMRRFPTSDDSASSGTATPAFPPPGCDGDASDTMSSRSVSTAGGPTPRVASAAPMGTQLMAGPHHEGWLSKLSSGKTVAGKTFAARWQRRYFMLDGFRLGYCQKPGLVVDRKSFDLRRAREVRVPHDRPRELELDYGFRVWHLRADNEEAARSWLLMLETARTLAGPVDATREGDNCEDLSDCDSGSTVSTTDSRPSAAGEQLGPMGACGGSRFSLATTARLRRPSAEKPLMPIADKLEVNPEELDRRFEGWLQGIGKASGDIVDGQRLSSEDVRRGCIEAWCGLWVALGASATAAGPFD